MTLRTGVVGYLVVLHLVFAAALVWASGGASLWLLGIEVVVMASLVAGVSLAGRLLRSLELGDEAARLIREGDFTTRLRTTGDARVNRLVDVYNTMADSLRSERTRIREQQHFLEQVVAASPVGILILDFEGRIADVNAAGLRLLDLSREAVLGQSPEALDSPIGRVMAGLAPGNVEIVGAMGGRRLRAYRGSFIDRGFRRTFLMVEELTEEIRRIERAAYEKLIRVMSHEVSNSVTATNSLLESALTYAPGLPPGSREEFEHALRIAIDRSAELNQFMRRFADVFRLPPAVLRPVNLRDVLDGLMALMRAQAPTVTVDWAAAAPADPVVVAVDRPQFEQACLNVLKNAVEAAGPGGRVIVALVRTSSGIDLTIDDSGSGPGPEAETHLFTPFFSTKPQGQGIGLTLVGEILTAHGFSYSLERLAGGITRFTIRAPSPQPAPA